MGPRNHVFVLDGVQIPKEKGKFVEKWRPIVKNRWTVQKTAESIKMPFGMNILFLVGPRGANDWAIRARGNAASRQIALNTCSSSNWSVASCLAYVSRYLMV